MCALVSVGTLRGVFRLLAIVAALSALACDVDADGEYVEPERAPQCSFGSNDPTRPAGAEPTDVEVATCLDTVGGWPSVDEMLAATVGACPNERASLTSDGESIQALNRCIGGIAVLDEYGCDSCTFIVDKIYECGQRMAGETVPPDDYPYGCDLKEYEMNDYRECCEIGVTAWSN